MIRSLLFIFIFLQGIPVILTAQTPAAQTGYSLFLIGDCGEPYITESTIGKALRREVTAAGPRSTVLYLGDNIYPKGMPGKDERGRAEEETTLHTQVDWIKGLDANGIFIPGNHDWKRGRRNGFEYIRNQQAWLDSLNDKHITLLPRDGCPGPVEIPLNDGAVLVIIDTQWPLHPWDKPEAESACDAKDLATLVTLLNDIFLRNMNKRVIVAGHHPLISYGEHGGVFTLKDHLFPLTDLHRNFYLPLPVAGSLYPLYRKWFGHIQDLQHPVYKEFASMLRKLLAEHPGSIYVAGHEHALQYIVKDSTYFIVSGAGSKTSYVKKKKDAPYADDVKGFVKLTVQPDGKVRTQYWQVDEEYPEGKIVFEDALPSLPPPLRKEEIASIDFTGKMVRVKASDQYSAGKARKRLLGANYRADWAQEIDVPVFDLGRERGGLTILQTGGGQQTLSLRLADSTGREYVLRSIEKYPENAVPEMFRKTFAQDLVQDQISASHPYAATVIPPLAEAAGIYHTNPRIVYIPDDPRFGIYRKMFANTLALYEERPADDWSDKAFFGNSKNIINTSKVLERLAKDNDNQVDQQFVLRSRIFDLWIGDWDRHDDQWRWATFKSKKEETYRPVPRDRDQTFFLNEGLIPKFWSRRWALPKFEGFDEEIDWPGGLSFNARYFDRSFLTEPSREDWIRTARELQSKLTDDVIEQAIRSWPEEIFRLHGEEIIRKLKARRTRLVKDAEGLYEFLALGVDVVGSDKNEKFVVDRLSNGDVDVKMFKITKEGEQGKKLYERLFKRDETHEIRLYGRGGDDAFDIRGDAHKSILVRVIGGDGKDSLADQSHVRGLRKKTLFYDLKNDNVISSSGETGSRTSEDPAVNVYDRRAFKYDRLVPLVFGQFNPDDGVFIGAGLLYQKEGFRKFPFAQRHIALASIAPRTNSYNFMYRGDFTNVFGKWGLDISADVKAPNYVNNFFGLGNETEFDDEIDEKPGFDVDDAIDYYRFRFEEHRLETYVTRRIGTWGTFRVGPAFQRIEVEEHDDDDEDRYIDAYAETLPVNLYEHNNYMGGSLDFTADKRNHPQFTTRGAVWNITGRSMAGLDKNASNFSSIESSLSLYHSFRLPARVVFAARVGGGITKGDYEFYQAQILSGRTDLRGFRKTRFYGDSKFYTNLELRIKLLSIRTYLFPASMGILGFHDLGRVWYKDENGIDPSAGGTSNKWHKGWGGGIWFTPFNLTVLSIETAASDEGVLSYVRLGFLF